MPLAGERVKASDLDFPVTQARGSTTTSLVNNVWTSVNLQTEDFDDDGMHDPATNPSRFTAQRAGRYELSGGVGHGNSATGRRGAKFAVNGTAVGGSATIIAAIASTVGTNVPARTVVVELAIGDFIELQGFQDSGGALSTATVAENAPQLTARFVGAG